MAKLSMTKVSKERDALESELAGQYANGLISEAEFEKSIADVNRAASSAAPLKELSYLKEAVYENAAFYSRGWPAEKNKTILSLKMVTADAKNGHAGKFTCVLGMTQIIIKNLPAGITVLDIGATLGFVEVFVPKDVRLVNKAGAFLAGVFMPEALPSGTGHSELHICGKAVLGNITVVRLPEG